MKINFTILGKVISIFSISLLFVLFFSQNLKDNNLSSQTVLAAEECIAEVSLVVRNQAGNFIPSIDYAIYHQTKDADDNPKPGTSAAAGKTNSSTGIGVSKFDLDDPTGDYLIKIWDKNTNIGAMYFYGALPGLTCGITVSKEISVSGIHIVLRDSQSVLKSSTNFKLYSQKYDIDGDPVKDQLVANFSTGTSGDVTTYVTDKTKSLDGAFPGYYVMEATGSQGGIFTKYNIKVEAAKTTEINYKFSDIAFTVKDAEGVPFPNGSELKIYQQKLDLDGEKIFGTMLKRINTNDKGVAVLEYPEGTYAASIIGGDGQTYKYYDLNMVDQLRKEITLQTTETYIPDGDYCSEKSFVDVITRSASGDVIPNLNVALYKQQIDANGVPIVGAKAISGKVASTGIAHLSFNPDPRATYVLSIYDATDKAGEFWFFDDIKFSCGEDKEIAKTLSSIKTIIRDAKGSIVPAQSFSIYAQKYDIDGNPIKEKSTLVKTLKTGGEGYATIYVASDHPYNTLKKGVYAFYLKRSKVEYLEYNIQVNEEEETVFEFSLPADAPVDDGEDDSSDGPYVPPTRVGSLLQRLQGYILLQVEERGEAWYVDGSSQKRYYMKNGPVAYEMLRKFGLGISTVDLENIPVGVDSRLEESDSDSDGLYDKMEEAIGSDPYDSDSDDDGFADGDELKAGYSPVSSSPAKVKLNPALVTRLLGKILLQVESRGEAWYLNPKDGKRYYMKDGDSAYEIMRFLSLGITNQDLDKISAGSL